MFSFYSGWWGGYTFGYRYLLDIIPFLCLFLIFSIEWILTSRNLKIMFIILVYLSIFIQIIGFLNYPSRWNSVPVSIDVRPERVWDIKDNQILRCINNGSHLPYFMKKYSQISYRYKLYNCNRARSTLFINIIIVPSLY